MQFLAIFFICARIDVDAPLLLSHVHPSLLLLPFDAWYPPPPMPPMMLFIP
jgi:hypothetical protein